LTFTQKYGHYNQALKIHRSQQKNLILI